MPLVRAANTGISAVVDSYGRIVGARSDWERPAFLTQPLPPALANHARRWRGMGDWTLAILLLGRRGDHASQSGSDTRLGCAVEHDQGE